MACIVLCPRCQQEYEVLLGTWRSGCPRCTTLPLPSLDESPASDTITPTGSRGSAVTAFTVPGRVKSAPRLGARSSLALSGQDRGGSPSPPRNPGVAD